MLRGALAEHWYADDAASGGGGAAAAMPWRDGGDWPSPLGLSLGLLAVAVGMCATLAYQAARYFGVGPIGRAPRTAVQAAGARPYDFMEGVKTHLSQPEGFVLLGLYLSGTWMLRLMPASYYSFAGGVSWPRVAAQLLVQDAVQFVMHRLEHAVSPAFYKASHKPHHRFVNPRIFDAFNGSAADTTLMILVPLYVTALTVRGTNVWTYMAFGSLYANWLTLIHSEWAHPWDPAFRALGLGTAADHHVHHKLFTKNYGHLFMYWDRACGSYRDPADVAVFNKGV